MSGSGDAALDVADHGEAAKPFNGRRELPAEKVRRRWSIRSQPIVHDSNVA